MDRCSGQSLAVRRRQSRRSELGGIQRPLELQPDHRTVDLGRRLEHRGQRRQLRHAWVSPPRAICRRRVPMRSAGWTAPGSSGCLAGRSSIRMAAISPYSTISGATTRPPDCGPGSAAPIRPTPRACTVRRGLRPPSNMPGARMGGSVWLDASGNVWLFGGLGLTAGWPGPGIQRPVGVQPRQRRVDVGRRLRRAQCRGVYGTQRAGAAGQRPGRARLGRVVEGSTPEISGCSGATATPRTAISEI